MARHSYNGGSDYVTKVLYLCLNGSHWNAGYCTL